ncbi:peptide chain release factor N(5)-glutamine methyltransferase [bacterium]|nr:peptide chain release factor N(5)-glutamine methyltransferase [bacterium]
MKFSFLRNFKPTVKEALEELISFFSQNKISEPKTDAQLLMAKALGTTRSKLPLFWTAPVSSALLKAIEDFCARRIRREPVQHIIGEWSFLDLQLFVGREALIPRPETEEWVEKLCRVISNETPFQDRTIFFADICTGTGAVGLSLAFKTPRSIGFLSDVSEPALKLAQKNLGRYPELKNRVNLVYSDLLSCFKTRSIDFIAGNPPYIPTSEVLKLAPDVRDFEPKIAIDGGENGLFYFSRILDESSRVLKPGGILALEHGYDQQDAILRLPAPHLAVFELGKDFCGKDRYIFWRHQNR